MLPKVAIFGKTGVNLKSTPAEFMYETADLDCRCYDDDTALENILIQFKPHVIVTFGEMESYTNLMKSPMEVRRKWVHFPDGANLDEVGLGAFNCYVAAAMSGKKDEPLVSVITPTYKTGARIIRPFQSLMQQTYANWEWVVVDDSDDKGDTKRMLDNLSHLDHRIRVVKPEKHSGIIGEVKRMACGLSEGALIVELDHDDELTSNCLMDIVNAHLKYPEVGFFYTDCAEVDTDMNPMTYCQGWGFGYGSYRDEEYRGRMLKVTNACNINPKTIRHLVAAPNHARVWTRECYNHIGGYNKMLHVADDFDLLVKTFLYTKMARIPKLGYIQYIEGGNNTQRVRNADIQRHVRYLRGVYDWHIHERFLELGLNDFVWNEEGYSDLSVPNPEEEPIASITVGI
jgi:glycosyltransferase involved in cell wall biosynthesis